MKRSTLFALVVLVCGLLAGGIVADNLVGRGGPAEPSAADVANAAAPATPPF